MGMQQYIMRKSSFYTDLDEIRDLTIKYKQCNYKETGVLESIEPVEINCSKVVNITLEEEVLHWYEKRTINKWFEERGFENTDETFREVTIIPTEKLKELLELCVQDLQYFKHLPYLPSEGFSNVDESKVNIKTAFEYNYSYVSELEELYKDLSTLDFSKGGYFYYVMY